MVTERMVTEEELVADVDRPTLISWGAVLAGLVFVIAMSWLLYLLGIAVGVSVADATDSASITNGLGTGVVIWMVISSLIVFFLGAMLTARLTGKKDATTGMLHGVTLWGVTTTLMLVMSYYGVTSLLQTGQNWMYSTASTMMQGASSVTSGVANTAWYAVENSDQIATAASDAFSSVAETKLVNNLQARVKRKAVEIAANSDAKGGAKVTKADVRKSIDQLDSQTLQQIATQLVTGDVQGAKDALAENTALSEMQVSDLVEGISNEFQERLGTADNDTGLIADLQNRVEQQAAKYIARLDVAGGATVTAGEIRAAINDIDASTLQQVAIRLVRRDVQGAKDILTANTNLSGAEVNGIIEGVNRDVQATIDDYEEELNASIEAASTYAQGVLWTVFTAAAIGLAISVMGGAVGADATQKLHVRHRQSVAV